MIVKKFLFLLPILCWGAPLQDHRLEPESVAQLADSLSLPIEHWLRPKGRERWEIEELPEEQRKLVIDWGKAHDFYKDWRPSRFHYDKAVILGATVGRMSQRLRSLTKLSEEGIRFETVVWLVGERPLDPKIEHSQCKTEAEAARAIWEENPIHGVTVEFISTPMKGTERPNTEDTLKQWNPKGPQTVLFVSNQPFCGYQFAVIQSVLPDEIDFDVVGDEYDPDLHPKTAAITLDTIARWVDRSRS